MTQPPATVSDGLLAQILVKQGEMSVQLGIIHEQLKDIPDHEQRIRLLETAKARIWGAAIVLGALAGGGAGWIALAIAHR
jgi:hypothetical protein